MFYIWEGGVPMSALELAALAQRGLTVLSSGFNAVYFARYRAAGRRYRWAAAALALVNLALLLSTVYLGLLPYLSSGGRLLLVAPRPLAASATVPLAASLLITALVLRSALRRR